MSTGILALNQGAKFYRADLHVHSFGASHDVSDQTMTPAAIIASAQATGLSLIAITDHNDISNVEDALSAGEAAGLLVVPGVELSTAGGHLLAYLPSLVLLKKFMGQMNIAGAGSSTSRCQNGLLDCLSHLSHLGGFGILAHVDAPGGFGEAHPTMTPHALDVVCHPALLGIELRNAQSETRYAEGDPDSGRASAGKERIERLKLGAKQHLARVLFSDAHSLSALGKNARGDKKVTRVKMATPSFESLRIALQDADARIRLEDLVPSAVPHILGVEFAGGFLDGQAIHLSPNLTCIIGGRGTGKSMTFEALRCLAGDNAAAIVDSEVWPADLKLLWRDAAGGVHNVQRLVGEDVINLDDPDFGPTTFRIESYGQGETAKLSQRAQSDPLALLRYLDGFVDVEQALQEEQALRDQLLDLQTKLEEAELKVSRIPEFERFLATTQQQLKLLEQAKAAEVIALQRALASERALRSRVLDEWEAIQGALDTAGAEEGIQRLYTVGEGVTLTVGAAEFTEIVSGAKEFEGKLKTAASGIGSTAKRFGELINEQMRLWKTKETEALQKIESKRKELEAQGVRLDMAYVQKLTKDEATYKKNLEALKKWKPHLTEVQRLRRTALRKRWGAREKVATIRDAFARQASETLKDTLSDLHVSLKFVRNALSPDAARQIQDVMGWRTNQVPRAALIVEGLTVPALLAAIDKRNAKAISGLAFEDGTRPFNASDAVEILKRLGEPKVRHALERCEVHDLPRLTVTKNVAPRGGAANFITRDFGRLSLGQQQSVLLALLLSSEASDPLIIDQPEDNLDGEFIYSSLVPVLRRAKERRQIVVVTHNANIAVLGDAELVVALRSFHDRGVITERGSIDEAGTRDAACAILEGSEEAFIRRARIYGVVSP